ncbi:MAG: 1-aminocyclopropane-1-carboxylate deaminase [Campylobacterales bacterium]|nr:1-aminocyclopropane-1-carboxylate deaminase [Campylobacterales bacterium]
MLPVLSYLAEEKKAEFIYYCKPIPMHLKENPIGNYKVSLKNTKFIEILHEYWHETIENLKSKKLKDQEILINQGGLQNESEEGIKILAKEIEEWAEKEKIKDLKIFLPSGTGTTALILQKNTYFDVFTTPCVGNSNYLKKQFLELENDDVTKWNYQNKFPTILDLEKKYHFGKPYEKFYQINKDLLENTKVEFELLYDSKGWVVLDKFKKEIGENILYLHQGGILGNESMLERYKKTSYK